MCICNWSLLREVMPDWREGRGLGRDRLRSVRGFSFFLGGGARSVSFYRDLSHWGQRRLTLESFFSSLLILEINVWYILLLFLQDAGLVLLRVVRGPENGLPPAVVFCDAQNTNLSEKFFAELDENYTCNAGGWWEEGCGRRHYQDSVYARTDNILVENCTALPAEQLHQWSERSVICHGWSVLSWNSSRMCTLLLKAFLWQVQDQAITQHTILLRLQNLMYSIPSEYELLTITRVSLHSSLHHYRQ